MNDSLHFQTTDERYSWKDSYHLEELYNFRPELDKNVADDVVVTYSKAHKDKGSNDWLLIFVLSVHKVSRYRIHTNLTFTLHASNTYSQFAT